jgi:solute carrier family 35
MISNFAQKKSASPSSASYLSKGLLGADLRASSSKTNAVTKTLGNAGIKSVAIAFAYMLSAICLLSFNKTALSLYDFPYANVITLLQLFVSTVILYVFKRIGLIEFRQHSINSTSSSSSSNDDDDDSVTTATTYKNKNVMMMTKQGFPRRKLFQKCLPLAIAYVTYMVLSMVSLRGVNLPMYTTLRRTTGAFTMLCEFLMFKKTQDLDICFAVLLMVVGAIVAGVNDMEFTLYGYVMVCLNNMATAVYLLTIGRISKVSGLNAFGLMWTNAIWCMGPLFLVSLIKGEIWGTIVYVNENEGFFKVLVGSCVLAFALNYSVFLNTAVNSALTQAICGNVKDLVVVWIGYVVFGGIFQWANFCGMLIGVLGSVLYAAFKMRKSTKPKDAHERKE